MATSTFAINAKRHHDHATSPSHERPEPSSASGIKPLSRSTSYSFNTNAGQPRAKNRSNPASPIDSPANTRYNFEDAHVWGHSMKGKIQTRPRGESDLGKPSPLRPVTNGFAAFASAPGSPITTGKTRWVETSMAYIPTMLTASLSRLPDPSSTTSEIINGILVPLPFLLAAIAFPTHGPAGFESGVASSSTAQHPYDTTTLENERKEETPSKSTFYDLFQHTCTLSAAVLLLVGILARIQTSNQNLDRRKKNEGGSSFTHSLMQFGTWRAIVARMLSIALPYYASLQLGGLRTAMNLGLVILSGLTSAVQSNQISKGYGGIVGAIRSQKFTCASVLLFACSDLSGMTSSADMRSLASGYLALVLSALAFPISLPILSERPNILARTASNPKGYSISTPPPTPRLDSNGTTTTGSSIFASRAEANSTLVAGVGLGLYSIALQSLSSRSVLSSKTLLFSALSLASGVCMICFVRPIASQAKGQPALSTAIILTSVFGVFQFYGMEMSPYAYWTFGAFGWFAILLDGTERFGSKVVQHKEHDHKPAHSSLFTMFLLKFCSPGSVMDTILRERDSRRIAYFGCLNLAFMVVQLFYGFATGSLGLLTDSIHMLFDCLGLAVGLAAAVMSKWPPSTSFPYGYGKINTLSGFANGIFLILVSIEIIFDAVHRLNEGHELRRLNELLLVSTLGFLVNIVGLAAFGHAHHGHDHGHSHAEHTLQSHDHSHEKHSHDHSHEKHSHEKHSHDHHSHGHHDHDHHSHEKHSHDHHSYGHHDHDHHSHEHHDHDHKSNHSHKHKHDHDHSVCEDDPLAGLGLHSSLLPSLPSTPFSMPKTPLPSSPPAAKVAHAHAHSHENENMTGIFLHIMADALGSVAVIISTILAKRDGWSGWDPIASCIIAIMIFISAIPLVKTSGMKLLLALPTEVEWASRDALQGISELRGVLGYSGVRLWLQDKVAEAQAHGHDHDHGHDHGHSHSHGEEQGQKVLGVMHVIAMRGADLEDVRERVVMYLSGRNMDIVVHVEREGD
ncbi:hypothetical protein E2P81_ATG11493 [Venturia nashicola]|nr:hypothetical protein E2P81_ATG11493 [Venturia nashicola]